MKDRITVIILSVVIVMLVVFGIIYDRSTRGNFWPLPGFGHHDKMMKEMPGRKFCTPEFLKEKLNLTDDQIVKINALNETFDREHDLLMKKVQPEQERLRTLLASDNPDMKEVRAVLERIGAVNIEIHMLRINQGRIISSMLNPGQKAILDRERRRHRGMGPGPGPGGLE